MNGEISLLAEDLRIGNWIHSEGKNYKVLAIDPLNVYQDCKGTIQIETAKHDIVGRWLHRCSPILLTPEILEKAGFEQNGFKAWDISINPHKGGHKVLSFSGDYLYIKEGSNIFAAKDDDIVCLWNKDLMKVFYLHQLQNLYFALCGTELKIEM